VSQGWQTGELLNVIKVVRTSTCPIIVHTTHGDAVVKALGNPEGPHALAREWVGTSLAREMGIPTFDFGIQELTYDNAADLMEVTGMTLEAGHAFVSRFETGRPWDGSAGQLASLTNPQDIATLIVFDTWIRNRDRCPPRGSERSPNYGNVWLSGHRKPWTLKAIDHTHCLDSGALRTNLANIHLVKDIAVYGAFEAFVDALDNTSLHGALAALRRITDDRIREIVQAIPDAWEVSPDVRDTLVRFLCGRARFLQSQPALWFQSL